MPDRLSARAMIDEHRIATLAAGLVLVAVALAVFFWRPGSRVHRAFGAFVGVRGTVYVLLGIDDSIFSPSGRTVALLLLVLPLLAANFAIVFMQHHRGGGRRASLQRERGTRMGLLLVGIVLVALYLMDRGLFVDDHRGWLSLATPVTYLSFIAVAWMLFLTVRDTPGRVPGSAIAILAVGFAVEPLYFPTFHVAYGAFHGASGLAIYQASMGIHLVTLLLGIAFLAELWLAGKRWHRTAAWGTGLGVAAAATGIWSAADFDVFRLFFFDAVWITTLAMAAAYATMRFQLFGIDLAAKRAIDYGSVAAVFAAGIFVASEVLEQFVPADGPVLGVAAAMGIALVLRPLHSLTKRLADRVMPGVDRGEDYMADRNEQLYLAAAASMAWDGEVSEAERGILRRFAKGLGLDDAQLARLDSALEPPR